MRRWWEWLGLNLGKRAGVVGIVGLAVTFVLGIGVTQLTFSTSNNDYLNKNDPAYVQNQKYTSLFGGDPMAVEFTMNKGETVDNLFTPANQKTFLAMEAKLNKDPAVFSVISPMDSMGLSQVLLRSPDGSVLDSPAAKMLLGAYIADTNPKSRAARWSYILTNAHGISQFTAATEQLDNPAWVHFITHEADGSVRGSVKAFMPNNTHALMVVYLQPNININQETADAATVNHIIEQAHFQNATVIITGVPAVLKEINGYLKGGLRKLGMLAAVVMVIILLLFFKVRWRLLPFAIVAVGLIWGFGLVGYLGVPLTLATITALPVLMGVGMDYSIQMHSRIEEEVVLDRAAHPIQAAARGLGPALLVVTFDAVFAFIAMWFAKVPAIRQFGSLLIIGIIAVCVCSIILTLAILGIREYKSPTTGKDFSKARLSRIVVRLGSVPAKAALPLMLVATVIFLGGVAVEGKLVMQTDPIQWLNQKAPAIQQIQYLKKTTGSDNQLGLIVYTKNPFSNQAIDYDVKLGLEEQARYGSDVYPPAGLPNILDEFMTTPGAVNVPPTGAEVAQIYRISPPGIRDVMMADNGRAMNMIFEGRQAVLSSLNAMVNNVASDAKPPPGIQVAPGGIAVVGVGLLENLAKSRTLLTYLALVFVGAFLAVRLRSIIRSLLSLVPVLVAVGAVSLVGVALNLKLSPITALSGPLVVAVCTEFTSLILLRFVEERARGLSPRQAMDVTASRTGRAFMVSGMTAVAGIGVLGTSSMPMLSGFGVILAMNVAVALVCALVVLPPVLVWADDDRRGWVSRSLISRRAARFEPYETAAEQATRRADEVPLFAPEPEGAMATVGAGNGYGIWGNAPVANGAGNGYANGNGIWGNAPVANGAGNGYANDNGGWGNVAPAAPPRAADRVEGEAPPPH
jgi:hydrophobe/amphiphile efflux-3 (HAE3) family protein